MHIGPRRGKLELARLRGLGFMGEWLGAKIFCRDGVPGCWGALEARRTLDTRALTEVESVAAMAEGATRDDPDGEA